MLDFIASCKRGAIHVIKQLVSMETARQLELVIGYFQILHAVEGIYSDVLILKGDIASNKVPPLLEHTDGIWHQFEGSRLSFPKALISDPYDFVFPHGLYYLRQVLIARRYLLAENTPFQVLSLQEHVADGKTVQEPFLQLRLSEFVVKGDVVTVGVLVALYIYMKLDANLTAVFEPCLAYNGLVVIEQAVLPFLVQLCQRQSTPSGLSNDVDFP